MTLQVGSTIGDFEVLSVLGKGGMGAVYKVLNNISDRTEALKVLNAELLGHSEMIDRFLAEIRIVASLNHPNITRLHTAFKIDNEIFMLMEFVDGITLSKRVQEAPIPIAQAVKFAAEILSALIYAHASGVIHRDIKPANLIVNTDGTVKLMDFGIAKSAWMPALTQPGATLGSVHYMSPEQAKCSMVDPRSDLYSLGIVLYEMTTGQRPFNGDSMLGILEQHLHVLPRPPLELNPLMPRALNDVILRALAKDPDQRFQDASSLAAALRFAFSAADLSQSSPPNQEPDTFVPQDFHSPSQKPPAEKPRWHGSRLVWLTVGSAAGIAVFCLSAFLISNSSKHSSADAHVIGQRAQPVQSVALPITQVPVQPPPTPATKHQAVPRIHRKSVTASASADSSSFNRPKTPNAESEALKDALQSRLSHLRAGYDAISANLETLRQQLTSQGVGLRSDLAAASSLAQSYLEDASRNIQAKHYEAARRDLDETEKELAKLHAVWSR